MVKAAETHGHTTWEECIIPICLVRGNDGLQGSKRGTVSEGNKRPGFHGTHGANEAIDGDILDRGLWLPVQELGNRRGCSAFTRYVAAC